MDLTQIFADVSVICATAWELRVDLCRSVLGRPAVSKVSYSHPQQMREVLHGVTTFPAPKILKTGLQQLVSSVHIDISATQKKLTFSVACCWASPRCSHFALKSMEWNSMRWRGRSGHKNTGTHCSLIVTSCDLTSCGCNGTRRVPLQLPASMDWNSVLVTVLSP